VKSIFDQIFSCTGVREAIGLISLADPNYQNQFERRGELFLKQNS
jgi:hypothetical protein